MQRLIILLAAALLTLTLACEAAGGIGNALRNEMGETGRTERVGLDTVEDYEQAVLEAGKSVPADLTYEDGVWTWLSDRYGVEHEVMVTPAELERDLTAAERDTILLRSGITGHTALAIHPDTGEYEVVNFTHSEMADGVVTAEEIRNAFVRSAEFLAEKGFSHFPGSSSDKVYADDPETPSLAGAVRSEPSVSGSNAVPAEQILSEYLDDELQATVDWEGERVLVTVPHIDECSPIAWEEEGHTASCSVDHIVDSAFGLTDRRPLSFFFKNADKAIAFRETLQSSCVVGGRNWGRGVVFRDCR